MSSKRSAWKQKHDVAMRDLKRLFGCPSGVCSTDSRWDAKVIGRLECQTGSQSDTPKVQFLRNQTSFVCQDGTPLSSSDIGFLGHDWVMKAAMTSNTQDLEVSSIHAIPLMFSSTNTWLYSIWIFYIHCGGVCPSK